MAVDETGYSDTGRRVAVGCLTFVTGAFGGGMIAVLIGKMVGWGRGCVPPDGLPACDWHVYAGVGIVVGAILLPTVAMLRIGRGDSGAGQSERG